MVAQDMCEDYLWLIGKRLLLFPLYKRKNVSREKRNVQLQIIMINGENLDCLDELLCHPEASSQKTSQF